MNPVIFYPLDALLARYMLWSFVYPPVCSFVTSRCCTKVAKRRITKTTRTTDSIFYDAEDLNEILMGSSSTGAPNAGGVGKNCVLRPVEKSPATRDLFALFSYSVFSCVTVSILLSLFWSIQLQSCQSVHNKLTYLVNYLPIRTTADNISTDTGRRAGLSETAEPRLLIFQGCWNSFFNCSDIENYLYAVLSRQCASDRQILSLT